MEELISTYGFAAVLLGTFVEGEAVLLLGGFLVHSGYLSFGSVLGAGFAGTFISAQLAYQIGRSSGRAWLDRWPRWRARSERVFDLIRRNQKVAILSFRLMYGFRILMPMAVGTSGVRPGLFTALNIVGGVAWAVLVTALGCYLGRTAEFVVADVRRYQIPVILGVIAIAVSIKFALWLWTRKPRVRSGASRSA